MYCSVEKKPSNPITFKMHRSAQTDYIGFQISASHSKEQLVWDKPSGAPKVFLLQPHKGLSVKRKFQREANAWRLATEGLSALEDVVGHSSYRQIMKMDKAVLPFILKDLRDNGGRWYAALEWITDENPVQDKDLGITSRMRESWLKWGRKNHYL
jgi:hypothetical protein